MVADQFVVTWAEKRRAKKVLCLWWLWSWGSMENFRALLQYPQNAWMSRPLIQECTCFPPCVAGIASNSPLTTPTVVFVSGFCSKIHVYIAHMYRCMHSSSNLGCSQSALDSGRASLMQKALQGGPIQRMSSQQCWPPSTEDGAELDRGAVEKDHLMNE